MSGSMTGGSGGMSLRNTPTITKQLMEPQVIQPGSTFDHVRKRNLLRHTKAVMERKPQKRNVKPKKGNAYKLNTNVPMSLLPRRYTRGELPCSVEHRSSGLALSWMCPLHNLDYEHYLPIFMDGIRCNDNPYKFIAKQAVKELIDDARGNSKVVTECLDLCVLPIRYVASELFEHPQVQPHGIFELQLYVEVSAYRYRNRSCSLTLSINNNRYALSTKDPASVLAVIVILKQLMTVHPPAGKLLIPHYRQVLGILNLFYCKGGKNLGDEMEYGLKPDDLVVEIAELLELMERTGGEEAFPNIKFMIPTYTSAFANL